LLMPSPFLIAVQGAAPRAALHHDKRAAESEG
jgi:hypothetical protein